MHKSDHPQKLIPPSKSYPRWMEESGGELLYLGWGERDFDRDPLPMHSNGGWVYWLVTEGIVEVQFPDHHENFTANTGMLAGPNLAFGFPAAGHGMSRILTWIWKRPPPHFHQAVHNNYLSMQFSDSETELLKQVHQQSRNEGLHTDSLSKGLNTHIHGIVDLIFQRAHRNASSRSQEDSQLKTARIWMLEHLDAERPIEDLARYLNISVITLHRLFKDMLGDSPGMHFRRLKMERAQELLRMDRYSIKHIAYELGYRHPNDFSRAYRKFWGQAPSEKDDTN